MVLNSYHRSENIDQKIAPTHRFTYLFICLLIDYSILCLNCRTSEWSRSSKTCTSYGGQQRMP